MNSIIHFQVSEEGFTLLCLLSAVLGHSFLFLRAKDLDWEKRLEGPKEIWIGATAIVSFLLIRFQDQFEDQFLELKSGPLRSIKGIILAYFMTVCGCLMIYLVAVFVKWYRARSRNDQ